MAYVIASGASIAGFASSVCPVDAIFAVADLPENERGFERANAEFFASAVTGWGAPGGADSSYVSALDRPLVAMREWQGRGSPHEGDRKGTG
jgi:ferredoxin